MRIHAIGGDIVGIAPTCAEASVLWLRSGFGDRSATWERLCHRYELDAELANSITGISVPWTERADRLITLANADQMLRHLYLFSNPEDGFGCATFDQIDLLVNRALDALAALGVKRVAVIRIPVAPPIGRNETATRQTFEVTDDDSWTVSAPRRADLDAPGAKRMIQALRDWGQMHPELIEDVFLVDLANAFGEL